LFQHADILAGREEDVFVGNGIATFVALLGGYVPHLSLLSTYSLSSLPTPVKKTLIPLPQFTRHIHRLNPFRQLSHPLRSASHTLHPAIRRLTCWSLEFPFSSLFSCRAYQIERGLRKVVRPHHDFRIGSDVFGHADRMWDAVVQCQGFSY